MTTLQVLLEHVRKRLVETGTRNRLIHVNRSARRANVLNVINERSDDLYDLLRVQSKRMRFLGRGEEENEEVGLSDEEKSIALAPEELDDNPNYKDSFIETALSPDALQKRLLRISNDSKTAEQEQGTNILFLNLGFLQWYEEKNSSVLRESPLVLLPVELIRNSKNSQFSLKSREEDLVTNLPLQERLKNDYGFALPDIEDTESWSPSKYFEQVERVIQSQPNWTIDKNGIQLGFFSFSKLLMLRDLDPKNWKGGALTNNPIIKSLLSEGFEPTEPLFHEESRLDEVLEPKQIIQVVDADASQTKVIEEVRSGRNMIVQGPPGTGKSQTITNILSAAAHDHKKVLFIAEKMAALDVVHKRLKDVGLKDLCLELHSRHTNKRNFLEELRETLSNRSGPKNPTTNADLLKFTRDAINDASFALHKKVAPIEQTPFTILAKLIHLTSLNAPPPTIDAESLVTISDEEEQEICNDIESAVAISNKVGDVKKHPFHGTGNLTLQPTDLQRLQVELSAAQENIKNIIQLVDQDTFGIHSTAPTSIQDLDRTKTILLALHDAPKSAAKWAWVCQPNFADERFLDALKVADDWTRAHSRLVDIVHENAYQNDLTQIRHQISIGTNSWFGKFLPSYRKASLEIGTFLKKGIPKSPGERLDIVDKIIEAQLGLEKYKKVKSNLLEKFGSDWSEDQTRLSEVLECLSWFKNNSVVAEYLDFQTVQKLAGQSNAIERFINIDPLISDIRETTKRLANILDNANFYREAIESAPFNEILEKVINLSNNVEKYSDWVEFCRTKNVLIKKNLSELVEFINSREADFDQSRNEFLYALYESRWRTVRKSNPALENLASLDRHTLVNRFMQLDRQGIADSRKMILVNHLDQLPKGSVGQMGFIRGEIAKKRRHRPIRQVMSQAGAMVQKIKPIFLMSPISVAQFLPPEDVEFDLVVMDEASQIRPEDALGSIARAKQLVVVGDQQQLPPTSFFDRLTTSDGDADEDEEGVPGVANAVDMESVLTLCEARGLYSRMLEWHYRSQDPSLIAVSNEEFYGNRLILSPTPNHDGQILGLSLRRVSGIYSSRSIGRGRPGTNRIEAVEVVRRLKEIHTTRQDLSVGIVTFSKAQADMMTEVLEHARREDPVLNDLLREDKHENVFVKNIENVQGDERDVILISVGYGPTESDGKLRKMDFGPINFEGGEKRLNVLFTRSRTACEVFVSFDPSDIDVSRTSKNGPRVLKKYLEFAESGVLPEGDYSEGVPDSPFEEDVGRVIKELGYDFDYQVGTSGFRIDIGVKDPTGNKKYIMAVECDGATYHSALWARERDRHRQEILENLGWVFHRIWSTDWFYRRADEIERLRTAIAEATVSTTELESNAHDALADVQKEKLSDVDLFDLPDNELAGEPYRRWEGTVNRRQEPHTKSTSAVARIVKEIVEVEGLIHFDEIVRRYASAHGKQRAGARIRAVVFKGLTLLSRQGELTYKSEFWGTEAQFQNPRIRDREHESPPLTKAEYLSLEEIIACAEMIKSESGEVQTEELIRAVSRVLGFKRAGPEIQTRIRAAFTDR